MFANMIGFNKRGELTFCGSSASSLSQKQNPGNAYRAKMMIRMGLATKFHIFNVSELKELCRATKLKVGGSKGELISRLLSYRHAVGADDGLLGMSIEQMLDIKKKDLKIACGNRGVLKSGNNRTLVVRILAADNDTSEPKKKKKKVTTKGTKRKPAPDVSLTPSVISSSARTSCNTRDSGIAALLTARGLSVEGSPRELKARLVEVLTEELKNGDMHGTYSATNTDTIEQDVVNSSHYQHTYAQVNSSSPKKKKLCNDDPTPTLGSTKGKPTHPQRAKRAKSRKRISALVAISPH